MSNDFSDFSWHSAIGIDSVLSNNKVLVTKLPNTRVARSMFIAGSDNTLIHKTTKCLWRFNDDKTAIEPVFATDVLTDDDCLAAMMEDDNGSI